ncbi:MAG: hypothetical protein ACREV8_00455, partial [Gammaproteobacteria bacterium]
MIIAVLGHFGLGHRDASALVLCFGADGHVAVEPAGHHHRSQAPDRREERLITEKGTYVLETGDSPCTDIPVISEDHGSHKPLIEAKDPSPDTGVLELTAFVIALIPFDELAPAPVFFPDSPTVDSRLSTLRSV